MYGFYRLAAASPEVRVGDVAFNIAKIIEAAEECRDNGVSAVVFPELCITGYSCADLFHQDALLKAALAGVNCVARKFEFSQMVIIVGAPLVHGNGLYNCAFVLQGGKIRGIVPKTSNPNYREFYEKRWFKSGRNIKLDEVNCRICGTGIPFGTNYIFECGPDFKFGIEICEDMWGVIPPSSHQAIAGANAIFNLSASNDLVAKSDYRRQLVSQQSARCIAAYIYTSAGVHESTTDLVFGGHSIIAENGHITAESKRFSRDTGITCADVDLKRLRGIRMSESSIGDFELSDDEVFDTVQLSDVPECMNLRYADIEQHPFVPGNPAERSKRCEEIFHIQAAGLAKRLEHVKSKKLVIGISGGLDSTLALLVCAETLKLLGRKNSDILAITMPGFGTTDRTYQNALKMIELMGAEFREINIKPACRQHFEDIGHDPEVHDITYENVQARERTQLLMDIANHQHGLLVGTGDLSEIALGWSTYNGDHMSMYAVNCSIPKTLIRFLIHWVADNSEEELREVLEDIIATPVSPELLPNDPNADIVQRTEEIVGPYELHDFFLYHMIKYGAAPEKISFLAQNAFEGIYDEEFIKHYLGLFIKRFFQQQFKRSCIPDGPKVGTISLSPRGDWRMPSDGVSDIWMESI
ncbi:NAD(+) synthase [Lentisphaerota bacterium ZTH]|nr:NAD(+) synthase [Lentisphaerota bacterium]WET06059.1 NAD(+) synthase [Lentisphaerota bacterium ZTH]